MVAALDASIGFGTETTYKTGVTPTRWLEYNDESITWRKNIKQGQGLRVGSRVARSARRVVPTADGGGDYSLDCVSKGMGLLLSYLLGTGTSTLVSAGTYQQVFTLADTLPSFTLQKGIPRMAADATFSIDPYTYLGCTADSFEFTFAAQDRLGLKATIDAADVTTATAYTAPSFAAAPNDYHFAGASIYTGTLTAPTSTALASAPTLIAEARSGTLAVSHNAKQDRYNFGGGGRKSKPPVGLRDITGKLELEYSSTTFRDAVLNDTPMTLVVTYTAGALSTGLETFQVAVPEIKLDGDLPNSNGTDPVMQSLTYRGLDNLSAAQPLWVVLRTSDAAL